MQLLPEGCVFGFIRVVRRIGGGGGEVCTIWMVVNLCGGEGWEKDDRRSFDCSHCEY